MHRRTSRQLSFFDTLIRERSRRNKCLTVSILGFAIFIILLAYIAFADGNRQDNDSSIVLSYVIFRHGDRNPTETYPKDPYNDIQFWRGGWGSLTNEGKLQMYNLGTFLRSRYKRLLGDEYLSSTILVRSSDHDRCLMSAGALLAAMYPPSPDEMWLPGLNWQPVPIHATPRHLDKLIVVKKPCPRYESDLKLVYNSEEMRKVDLHNTPLYERLSHHTGQNISSVLGVEFLFNTLEIESMKGMQLPTWVSSDFQEMKGIAALSLAVFTQTQQMKRLVGGPLINDLREKMELKYANKLKPDRSVFLISAHDVTIVNILKSLGFDHILKPEFGASILFELHKGSQGFGQTEGFIKLFYLNNTTMDIPTPMNIPGCSKHCTLNEFLSATSNVALSPEEWEKECLIA